MAYFLKSSLVLQLSATAESYPFDTKWIPIAKNMSPVILGISLPSTIPPTSPTCPRSRSPSIPPVPHPQNGWFATRTGERDPPGPVPVGQRHAEISVLDGEICIGDLQSGFGTYVNGVQVLPNDPPKALKKGDVISLGLPMSKNSSTPPYLTDNQLKPIIATVDLVGSRLS